MKIKCPKCASEYNFPEDKLKPEGTKVRCVQCSSVFLVRAGSASNPATKAPAAKTSAAKGSATDDLNDFFGTTGSKAVGTGPASESLDDMFDAGGNDDVLGSANNDDLFGNDDDLFGGSPAAKAETNDDLFGEGDDLFSAPDAAISKPKTQQPAGKSAAASEGEADLNSLFDDSDVPTMAAAPKPTPPPAGSSAKAAPNFDWDDAGESETKAGISDQDEFEADFSPAIQEGDAERVMQQTLVRDAAPKVARKGPRTGSILVLLVLICIAGVAGFVALNPDVTEVLLQQAGLKQPPAPIVYTSPIVPVNPIKTSLVQNRNGYSIFVVEGELKNGDSVPHSFVRLRVNLADEAGAPVTSTMVFAGNVLSPLQLKNFPTDELEKLLRVEMGAQLRNFNLKPGEQVPFMSIFAPAPDNYADLSAKAIVLDSARGER